MKFATTTLTLAGALLFGIVDTSLAGRGLLDSKCNCATQKGATQKGAAQKGVLSKYFAQKASATQKGCGSPGCAQKGPAQKGATQKGCDAGCAQKGHPVQKGRPVQKGAVQKRPVVQKGVVQKGCGKAGCSKGKSSSVCVPNPLPTVLHGIDHVLNTIFQCNSCGSKSKGCGCGSTKTAQKGPSQKGCGCGSSAGTYASPPNPFVDDELEAPPIPATDESARTRQLWNLPQPVRHRRQPTAASRSVVRTTSAKKPEPRALPVESAAPILKQIKTEKRAAPVTKASSQTRSGLRIPKNPLRGT